MKKLLIGSMVCASVVMAWPFTPHNTNNFSKYTNPADAKLRKEALENDLIPIPTDKSKLQKYIQINTKDNPLNPAKIELGKKLYFDPRISRSGLISCNTCHNLSMGGVDGIPVAIGHKWAPNPHHLNSPTVYNSVFFIKQFWDGRVTTLAEQAGGPSTAHVEMASTAKDIEAFLNSIPTYVNEFRESFNGEKPTFENFTKAVAAFEATLITPSRYDDYLNGDDNALTPEEKKGLKTFIAVGCTDCHSDIALGGTRMETFPQLDDFKYENVGDYKGNKKGETKVPTLRNITETAPYFHNGTVWSLREATEIMANTQLGMNLSKEQLDSIVTFLKALDGRKPKIDIPQLPVRTDKTPVPQPDLNLK